jgi:hypothetical protein
MTARSKREKVNQEVVPGTSAVDPNQFAKKRADIQPLHLNLRLVGESAQIYQYLESCTPDITDSLRIRDCIRLAAFLIAMKERNTAVSVVTDGGAREDLLEHVGAFYPQSRMDTRRRKSA